MIVQGFGVDIDCRSLCSGAPEKLKTCSPLGVIMSL
jgi:hypothetical protein